MIIAVASGKGGTGKTTIATSLALALVPESPVSFLDCDVEAPNAHLYLQPVIDRRMDAALPVPVVDDAVCQLCGTCAEVCQFNAIAVAAGQVMVFPDLCHGCGSCTLNCPEGAIHEEPHIIGRLEAGSVPDTMRFARGVLNVGQPLAVPIIHQLKHWVQPAPDEIMVLDAPPGTSCPMVETVRGTDYVLLVTEPTPFGLHDLNLAWQVTQELGIPAGVIINREGIGDDRVAVFCAEHGIPVLMSIPFEREVAAGIASGQPLLAIRPQYRAALRDMLATITAALPLEVPR